MLHIYSIQHSEAKIFQLISEIARKWISDRNPQFVPLLVAYDTQSAPFPNSFFSERMTKSCPILWWKGALKDPNLSSVSASKFCFERSELVFCQRQQVLLRLTASSQTCGYIHNKMCNRLGCATAAKLVFCYQMLRGEKCDEFGAEDCSS